VLFDRRPFYLIGGGAGLVLALILWFALPRVTAAEKVQEQLAILSREPWTEVEVQGVEYGGGSDPQEAVLRGVRRDTNLPVRIHFVAKSPYTSPDALKRLSERPLDGQVAEVLMLPRSLTLEPYRSEFKSDATHAGVALFAGFPTPPEAPAATSGDMSVETPVAPAAAPETPAPAASEPPTRPATGHGTHG
jgi:hypothetical protein